MQEKNREISVLKERIIKYLKLKGISKYEFYNTTGISNGILSQKSGISEENILRFISYCKDVNPIWLLTGEGPMLREAEAVQTHGNQPAIASVPKHKATASPECAQCAVKDKIIACLEATIEAQKNTIESQNETIMLLKIDLEACGRSKKSLLPDTLPDEVTAKLKKD